jgi:8-oxo-dGTP diphosphatase
MDKLLMHEESEDVMSSILNIQTESLEGLPAEDGCCGKEIPDQIPPFEAVKTVYVSAGVLIDRDRRILIAQRPEGKAMAGLWEFPGGKISEGESPEYALVRELYEELGIVTCLECLQPLTFASHHYDDFHLMMPVFACRKWKGQLQSKEGQALKWVKLNELSDYAMPEADKPLIPILHDLL